MSAELKPSPRPWAVGPYSGHVCAATDDRRLVAACRGYSNNMDPNTMDINDVNALHIVRCVNHYDALRDALIGSQQYLTALYAEGVAREWPEADLAPVRDRIHANDLALRER